MKSFLNATYNSLLFIYKLNSARFLTLVTVLVFLLHFAVNVIEGSGTFSILEFGGESFPYLYLYSLISTVNIIVYVTLLIIVLNLSEFFINGHAMHVFIARNKNRVRHFGAFLLALFLFTIPIALGNVSLYFIISPSLMMSFYALIADIFSLYGIMLLTITLLNIRIFRTQPIVFLVLIFFALPMVLKLLTVMNADNLLEQFLKQAFIFTHLILSPHLEISTVSETLAQKSFFQAELFLKSIAIFGGYVVFNLFHFSRKDLL